MNARSRWIRLALTSLLVLVLVLGATYSVLGQGPEPLDTGPRTGPSDTRASSFPSSAPLEGAASDALQGAIPSSSSRSSGEPAGPAGVESTTDVNVDVDALRPEMVAATSVMHFLFVAGSAFNPRNSTYTYAESGGGGCIYQVAGSTDGIFNVNLQLPEGAVIDKLRLFYYDSSANNAGAWVTEYDGAGGMSDVAYIQSTSAAGYGNAANTAFSYMVKNNEHGLVLKWRSNQLGSTMQLCGMRIRYWIPPPCCSFMPVVSRQ
jgi:hypothetical protein